MNDIVSVIVPAFNAMKTIERCISSILSQSYTNLQVIVVDDGSLDNTYSICETQSQIDSRLRVFKNPKKGVSSARNYGISQASGKYVVFVDSDDYLEKTCVEALLNARESDTLVGSSIKIISAVEKISPFCETEYTTQQYLDGLVNSQILGICLGYLFERESICYFDETLGYMEDTLMLIKYCEKIKKIKYTSACYCYVDNVNGITKTKDVLKIAKNLQSISNAIEQMKKYFTDSQLSYDSKLDKKIIRVIESEVSKVERIQDCKTLLQVSNFQEIFAKINTNYISKAYYPFTICVKSGNPVLLYLYISFRKVIKSILRRR